MKRTKRKATRDLFSVSLSLEMIIFALSNIKEDLDFDFMVDDVFCIEHLRDEVKKVKEHADNLRTSWEHEEDEQ